MKEACGPAHLKVILETGELANYDQVRRASLIAMYAGADFIKTSTGKVTVNATLPVTLAMFEAIRDFYHVTGKRIGMKPAGGISNAKLALAYLVALVRNARRGVDDARPFPPRRVVAPQRHPDAIAGKSAPAPISRATISQWIEHDNDHD